MLNVPSYPKSAASRAIGVSHAARVSGGETAKAGLGNNGNTVRGRREKGGAKSAALHVSRMKREVLKLEAGRLMRLHEVRGAKAVTCCGTKARHGAMAHVGINKATGRASFGGVYHCSNVWACPVCARRISRARADEANKAIAAARKDGLSLFLVTLTFRHHARMALASILGAMKEAKQKWARREAYRDLPLVGTITATETTHGRNGFHPHMHMLVVLDCQEADGLKALKALGKGWVASLNGVGLDGGKAAFDVQGGTAAGDYIAKSWQAGEELTLGADKLGRDGGRTPEQLLADAADGCSRSRALWVEYARAMAGKRQLVWSAGLKARFKINEVSDEEAAELADAAAFIVVRSFTATEWESAKDRKAAILRAVERGASIRRAWMGPTDAERWRRVNGDPWER